MAAGENNNADLAFPDLLLAQRGVSRVLDRRQARLVHNQLWLHRVEEVGGLVRHALRLHDQVLKELVNQIDVESAALQCEFFLLFCVHVVPCVEDVALAGLNKLLAQLVRRAATVVKVKFGSSRASSCARCSHLFFLR